MRGPVDCGIRQARDGFALFDADHADTHAVQRLADLDHAAGDLDLAGQVVRVQPLDEHLQTEDILELVNAGAIDITVATPMTIPRIVRAERSFWARIADTAIPAPSAKLGSLISGRHSSVMSCLYSNRNATMGSSLAALRAG